MRWRLHEWSAFTIIILLLFAFTPLFISVSAHGDEDHSKDSKTTVPTTGKATMSVVTAERNIHSSAGQFNVKMQRSPADVRSGEESQISVRFSEKVEGGFGGGEATPLESATVSMSITTADGKSVAQNISVKGESDGDYHIAYAFPNAGEYKIIFNVTTNDNRNFVADFPVSVVKAPINWAFWFGLGVLALVVGGAIASVIAFFLRSKENISKRLRKAIPITAALLLFFTLATITLAYFKPPRQRRSAAQLQAASSEPANTSNPGDAALGGSGARITVSKESQMLFKIRTETLKEKEITGGLKVTGVVKAKPDAKAIVTPPVSGRVFLKQGLTVGSAVGRGEQIGTIEQVLGAPEQASLEAQKVALRTAALEQQARKAEQDAQAQQARTRLAQAQRELRRSQNLYEVGAAPKKRVEEAQTAVTIAEQEVASAEKQARAAAEQVKLSQEAVVKVAPIRSFPLLAPVTGLINEMKATSGQQVEAGTELLNIVNLSNVFLEAQVFEKDLPVVREATRASYTAAGIPGEVYKIGDDGDSRLLTIGQTVNPETRTVPVIYEVKNPLNRLRDGMFVEITIDTTGANKVLSVPKSAVITEQGKTFVFVFLGGETFEKRVVVLGVEGLDFYEVKSGLKTNERVVTEGVYQLRTTQPGA